MADEIKTDEPVKAVETPPVSTGGDFNPPSDGDIRKSLSPDIGSKIVDFSDFTKIVGEKEPPTDDKTTVPKSDEKQEDKSKSPEGEKKVEQPAKEQPIKQEVHAPDTAVVKDEVKVVDSDKQKYGEAAVGFFPKMAKEAREFLKARLDDLANANTKTKELEAKLAQTPEGLPINYLDHPEAFTLDPKYRQAISIKQNVGAELNYWRQQLIAVRDAKKWNDLTRDDKGNLVQVEREPGADADVLLTERISQAIGILASQDGEINRIQSSFKQNFANQRQEFKKLEDEYFPNYAGDKGKDNQYIKTFTELLGAKGQKDNILTPTFAMLYAFTMEREAYIKQLEANTKKEVAVAKAVVNAGPNSADINNVGGDKKVIDINQKPFDMKEFKDAKGD